MRVCRFSCTGFDAHHQGHLEQDVSYLLAQDFSQIPAHLVHFVKEAVKEVNPQWKSHLRGFWVFVGTQAEQDPMHVRLQLNHLKETKDFQWFEADMCENTLCYPSHAVLRGTPRQLKSFSKGDAIYVIKFTD